MTTHKHRTPEYRRSRKILRDRVAATHKAGMPALCWRGGGVIMPGTPWDVGHLPGARGSSVHDMAPEHRHATPGCCDGNRREGGRLGALMTNKTPARTVRNAGNVQTWNL